MVFRPSDIVIRAYRPEDFPILRTWWVKRVEAPPTEGMMPEGTSYVAEIDDVPIASMCWVRTNMKEVAYSSNFISDPDAEDVARRRAVELLFAYICNDAKAAGYKYLLAFGYQPKLTERFKKMGYRHTSACLNSFCLDL